MSVLVAQITFKANNIGVAKSELDMKVKEALMECGRVCEDYAKASAPVKTGNLRDNMDHKMADKRTVAIGTDVEYGKYQELGTSRGIVPKYFLTNAARKHTDEYQSIIENTLK